MDFHAAMETFAEAWMAANSQPAESLGPGSLKKSPNEDQPSMQCEDQTTESSDQNAESNENGHCASDDTDQRSGCVTPADPGSTSPARSRSSPVMMSSSSPSNSNCSKTCPTTLKVPSPRKTDTPQPNAGGRSLPVHCVIEQISNTSGNSSSDSNSGESSDSSSPCNGSTVEMDSYAILPAMTPLCDLVRVALIKLGYSTADGNSAKGAIQLKNWKPLAFDVITDDAMATIDDILGEHINSATLRIRLSSQPKLGSADDMKEKLLQLLLTQSQSLLFESGCPIEKTLLTSISKGDNSMSLPEELCAAFNSWYNSQLQKNRLMNGKTVPCKVGDKDKMERSSGDTDVDVANNKTNPERKLSSPVLASSSPPEPVSSSSPKSQSQSSSLQSSSTASGHQQQTSPQLPSPSQGQVLTPSKTRIRTSFDPEHEIPRLQKWFTDNQHPTREQMVRYMNELNNLESRKGRRPLDLTNIIYWFKNARAAQRRASKALDDSFENEENVDVNSSHSTGIPSSPADPPPVPYLPNKNAVYVIPFPYHSSHSSHSHHMLSDSLSESYDEPCDLSIKKVRDTPSANHLESRATPSGRGRSEGLSQNGENSKLGGGRKHSPVRSSYSAKSNGREEGNGHKSPAVCNGFSENLATQKSLPTVVKELGSGGTDNSHKWQQGQYQDLKDADGTNSNSLHAVTKREMASDGEDNMDGSDESNGSGRLKINEDEDETDYGQRMRNGLTLGEEAMVMSAAESSAASMAALSLAQMSQPLHIPQLPPHLAMYYPMAPRYYPPPPSHHAQSSAAATAAMVAALSNSGHLVSKAGTGASSISISSSSASSSHSSTSSRTVPIQPASHTHLAAPQPHHHARGSEPRKRRTRVFIDPLTEIPKLEKWFQEDTHPSAYMIDKYTEALNSAEYRQKFPRLEPKNIQLWFKNHRAKVKRMRLGLDMEDSYCDSPPPSNAACKSPMPEAGREETNSSSLGPTGGGSKNNDESPTGCNNDIGNEDEMMEEDAQ